MNLRRQFSALVPDANNMCCVLCVVYCVCVVCVVCAVCVVCCVCCVWCVLCVLCVLCVVCCVLCVVYCVCCVPCVDRANQTLFYVQAVDEILGPVPSSNTGDFYKASELFYDWI